MSIITLTEFETGRLVDIDTDIVFIASLTHQERGTLIVLEQKDRAGRVQREEHHVRESFSKVVDALARTSCADG